MKTIGDYIEGIILGVIILITGAVGMERYYSKPQDAPLLTIRQQVLSYPYRDNSSTLRAAERKVIKKIDKVERTYCEEHLDEYPCGTWQRRDGKWEKP